MIVMRSGPKNGGILFEVLNWTTGRPEWELFVAGPFIVDDDVVDDRLVAASREQLAAALALHPRMIKGEVTDGVAGDRLELRT